MSKTQPPDQTTTLKHNEQAEQRQQKCLLWRQTGRAYPNDFKRNALAGDLKQQYDNQSAEALEASAVTVSIAGRMMTRRLMGKASFATLQDMSGKIQIYVTKDALPEGEYPDFKNFDLGDILGVVGSVFKTKTNELSIKASQVTLLTKALQPMPDKFHGLADREQRYRQRYIDLMVNEKTRTLFQKRAQTITYIREFFNHLGYMEVETPMMHALVGGAAAKPFITHHNTLNQDLYLRIAPELYLKRLVVGGFEKVYEINRSFRNEGISTRHNPEFTMIEFYQAYAQYTDMMALTEQLLKALTQDILGTSVISYQGKELDFSKPFTRMTLLESIQHVCPEVTDSDLTALDSAKRVAATYEVPVQEHDSLGKIQTELFEKLVEKHLQQPTFITAYPKETSPLARTNEQDSRVTDRFEFFVAGQEMANGFSELNDPEDQAQRFKAQLLAKSKGDEETMDFDTDYITALEYGMPPTAGEGIGIDRLVMLLTDSASIRDVVLFPLLRDR